MPKLIFSYKECAYRKDYNLDHRIYMCGHPKGTPWCKVHEHDLKDGFPWDCPLVTGVEE